MLIDSIDANTIMLLSCCCSIFLGFAGLDRYLVRRRAVATNRDHIARLQAIRVNYSPRRSGRTSGKSRFTNDTRLGELQWDEEIVSSAPGFFSRRRILRDRLGSVVAIHSEQLAMADRLLGKATSTFTRPQLLLTAGKA